LAARINVIERDDAGYSLKIRIGGTIYESIGDGIFIVEIDKVRGIKSKEIPDDVSLQIVKYGNKDYYEPICYTVLNTEVYYNRNGYVWIRIFQFKPRKYLKIRLSGRFVSVLKFLEAYFKALEMAPELDPRLKLQREYGWRYDIEVAEAHLSIELDPELTLEECVNEVKQIFRKIEVEAFSKL
jgi:hypothetical protein